METRVITYKRLMEMSEISIEKVGLKFSKTHIRVDKIAALEGTLNKLGKEGWLLGPLYVCGDEACWVFHKREAEVKYKILGMNVVFKDTIDALKNTEKFKGQMHVPMSATQEPEFLQAELSKQASAGLMFCSADVTLNNFRYLVFAYEEEIHKEITSKMDKEECPHCGKFYSKGAPIVNHVRSCKAKGGEV